MWGLLEIITPIQKKKGCIMNYSKYFLCMDIIKNKADSNQELKQEALDQILFFLEENLQSMKEAINTVKENIFSDSQYLIIETTKSYKFIFKEEKTFEKYHSETKKQMRKTLKNEFIIISNSGELEIVTCVNSLKNIETSYLGVFPVATIDK